MITVGNASATDTTCLWGHVWVSQTDGSSRCQNCGLTTRPNITVAPALPSLPQQGWICPRCHQVWAPWAPCCTCKPNEEAPK
jgi:hypothetical protein